MRISDWSSDVCSSDLLVLRQLASTYHQADDATVERVARALATYERGDWCRRLEWQNWIGNAKAAIAAMRASGGEEGGRERFPHGPAHEWWSVSSSTLSANSLGVGKRVWLGK